MKSLRIFSVSFLFGLGILGCEQPKVEVKKDSDLSKVIGGDFQKQTSGSSTKIGSKSK